MKLSKVGAIVCAILVCFLSGCGPKPPVDKHGRSPMDMHLHVLNLMNDGAYDEIRQLYDPDDAEWIDKGPWGPFERFCDTRTGNRTLSDIEPVRTKLLKSTGVWYPRISGTVEGGRDTELSLGYTLEEGEWRIVR